MAAFPVSAPAKISFQVIHDKKLGVNPLHILIIAMQKGVGRMGTLNIKHDYARIECLVFLSRLQK